MNILLTGGGTGGHTIPLVVVAAELKKRRKDLVLFWIGGEGIEEQAARENNIAFGKIVVGKFRRYFSFSNLLDFFKIPIGFFQSFFLILGFKPDLVFSKGGYVSLPVVFAAFLLRKKIIIHESDLKPGLANRIGARLASKVLLGFKKGADEKQHIFVGNPIREEILQRDKAEGCRFFNLDPERKTILILGGSQGARFLNQLITKAKTNLGEYQLIHLVGPKYPLPKTGENYKPYNWLAAKRIGQAYAAADFVISRAGANTLAEIAACGKPSILIPMPRSAAGHQLANAKVFEREGASIVLEQESLSRDKLIKIVKSLLANQERLKEMGLAAQNLACPDASSRIVSSILNNVTNLNDREDL